MSAATLPLVYVAGPITVPEPMENCHRAFKVGTLLRDSGLVVPFVPHTTCMWHMVEPAHYEAWMAYYFEIIRHCDALYRMPGESSGADREVDHAHSLAIPVFVEINDLLAWAAPGGLEETEQP